MSRWCSNQLSYAPEEERNSSRAAAPRAKRVHAPRAAATEHLRRVPAGRRGDLHPAQHAGDLLDPRLVVERRRRGSGSRRSPSSSPPTTAARPAPRPARGASRRAPGAPRPGSGASGPRPRPRRRRSPRRPRRRSASAPRRSSPVITWIARPMRESSPPEATFASGCGGVTRVGGDHELDRLVAARALPPSTGRSAISIRPPAIASSFIAAVTWRASFAAASCARPTASPASSP